MKERNVLNELLKLDGTISYIVEIIGENLENKEQATKAELIKFIEQANLKSKMDVLELDTLINNMQADLTLEAFYLGIDFTLNLLDRRGVK